MGRCTHHVDEDVGDGDGDGDDDHADVCVYVCICVSSCACWVCVMNQTVGGNNPKTQRVHKHRYAYHHN